MMVTQGTPYPLGGSSFTVEAWVLSRTPLAEGQGIFEFSDGRHARRIALELQPGTGRMLYSVDNTELGGTPAAQGVLASHEAFPANTWLHVVLTHNADGTASMYWDDHLQVSPHAPGPLSPNAISHNTQHPTPAPDPRRRVAAC